MGVIIMEVSDSCGKPIIKGSYVIYSGTGTIGKVIDTKTENESTWVKQKMQIYGIKAIICRPLKEQRKKDLKKNPGKISKKSLKTGKNLLTKMLI